MNPYGDTAVIRALNFYTFVLFFGILLPLIAEIIGFGLNYIGGTSTAGALTMLPPLISYSLFFFDFILGCALFLSHNPSLVVVLLPLHFITFIHCTFFILIPAWHSWLDCIDATIFCDSTGIFLYSFGFITIIILWLAVLLAMMAMWTYAQSRWKRDAYVNANETTYRSLTGDDMVTQDDTATDEVTQDDEKPPKAPENDNESDTRAVGDTGSGGTSESHVESESHLYKRK